MLENRVIPCLLLEERRLIKTTRFRKPRYVGDPINVVRILNEKEVDELLILDVAASRRGRPPDYEYIEDFVGECFIPVCYGGGVKTAEDARRLFHMGIEKVSISTAAFEQPGLVEEMASLFGSQSVVVCVDVLRRSFGGYEVRVTGGSRRTGLQPGDWSREMEERGAGEVIVNAIHRDGTMKGYDLDLIQEVTQSVSIPVVACGGAGDLGDLSRAVLEGGASAASAGSKFVYHGKNHAVLINYPGREELKALFRA